jgi:hypothetical protein
MQRNRKWIAGVMYHRTLKGELDVDADARDAATLLDDPASGPAAASRLAGAADAASDDEGKQLKQKSVAGKKAEKAAVARSKKRQQHRNEWSESDEEYSAEESDDNDWMNEQSGSEEEEEDAPPAPRAETQASQAHPEFDLGAPRPTEAAGLLGDLLSCYSQLRLFGLTVGLSHFKLADLLAALAYQHESLLLSDIHIAAVRVLAEEAVGLRVEAVLAPFPQLELSHLNWPEALRRLARLTAAQSGGRRAAAAAAVAQHLSKADYWLLSRTAKVAVLRWVCEELQLTARLGFQMQHRIAQLEISANSEIDDGIDSCAECGNIGELLLCDGCGCGLHLGCTAPRLAALPGDDEEWYCGSCTGNKDAFTVALTPLGADDAGHRYWLVGGALWREAVASGSFELCGTEEVARWVRKAQSGVASSRRELRLAKHVAKVEARLLGAPPAELVAAFMPAMLGGSRWREQPLTMEQVEDRERYTRWGVTCYSVGGWYFEPTGYRNRQQFVEIRRADLAAYRSVHRPGGAPPTAPVELQLQGWAALRKDAGLASVAGSTNWTVDYLRAALVQLGAAVPELAVGFVHEVRGCAATVATFRQLLLRLEAAIPRSALKASWTARLDETEAALQPQAMSPPPAAVYARSAGGPRGTKYKKSVEQAAKEVGSWSSGGGGGEAPPRRKPQRGSTGGGSMCEDCNVISANYGVEEDGYKKRWCGGCGKKHGAVNHAKQVREASQRNSSEKQVRAPRPAGARPSTSLCEDCGVVSANYGVATDGYKKRWCGTCGHKYGAVNPSKMAPARGRGRPKGPGRPMSPVEAPKVSKPKTAAQLEREAAHLAKVEQKRVAKLERWKNKEEARLEAELRRNNKEVKVVETTTRSGRRSVPKAMLEAEKDEGVLAFRLSRYFFVFFTQGIPMNGSK